MLIHFVLTFHKFFYPDITGEERTKIPALLQTDTWIRQCPANLTALSSLLSAILPPSHCVLLQLSAYSYSKILHFQRVHVSSNNLPEWIHLSYQNHCWNQRYLLFWSGSNESAALSAPCFYFYPDERKIDLYQSLHQH